MANSVTPTDKGMVLGCRDIMKILPHRYPFLLVDRIIDVDIEKKVIVGVKGVTINEPFFQGHFPQAPLMPGVLILEALAQVGGVLSTIVVMGGIEEALTQKSDKTAVLMSVQNAKFRHPVRPGDQLTLRVEGVKLTSRGGKVKAIASVDGKLAVEAEIGYAQMPSENV
jgi:3-hydroxyacyl-[acyl-carrier-protein] dehydratase